MPSQILTYLFLISHKTYVEFSWKLILNITVFGVGICAVVKCCLGILASHDRVLGVSPSCSLPFELFVGVHPGRQWEVAEALGPYQQLGRPD